MQGRVPPHLIAVSRVQNAAGREPQPNAGLGEVGRIMGGEKPIESAMKGAITL
jgi:hypothetical protein